MKKPMFDVHTNIMSPEEYAGLWGCDGSYDRPPNEPGDGALFYNFNVLLNDKHFLRRFIPAIERTMLLVQASLTANNGHHTERDLKDLGTLKSWVE